MLTRAPPRRHAHARAARSGRARRTPATSHRTGSRAVDVRLELVAELVGVRGDRHRRRVAERAQALADDPVADGEEQVELALRRVAGLELAQDRGHPACPLAARRALAARLVLVELRDADAELHHADAVVDADDPGRAHRRAGGGERVEVVADVDLVAREDHRGRPAGDDRLQLPAVGDAAAELLDDRAQRHPVLDLVVAAVDHVAGDRDDARAGRVLDAELRVLRRRPARRSAAPSSSSRRC